MYILLVDFANKIWLCLIFYVVKLTNDVIPNNESRKYWQYCIIYKFIWNIFYSVCIYLSVKRALNIHFTRYLYISCIHTTIHTNIVVIHRDQSSSRLCTWDLQLALRAVTDSPYKTNYAFPASLYNKRRARKRGAVLRWATHGWLSP